MSLINIKNLSFMYDGSYDNIFRNVSFQIDTDWKLGFIGRNGKGKTTFLNLLLEKYEYSGSISASVDFQYFPFEVKNKNKLTIDIINGICPACEKWHIMCELKDLEISSEVLYRNFNTLSNGEQTKVLLAALFLNDNSYLLIDEPTNHLDSHGRDIIMKYLNKKIGFILVSHDRTLLDGTVDHILSINNTNIEIQQGNFSSWYENKQKQDSFERAENNKLEKEIKRLKSAAKQSEKWSGDVEKTKYATKFSGIRPDRGFIGHKSAKMMKRSKSIDSRRKNAVREKTQLLKNTDSTENLKIAPLLYHSKKLVEFKDIEIQYQDHIVLKNLDFSVSAGERVALCGGNGCGKSSVLKLIYGENISYSGEFKKGSGLIISYVPQSTGNLSGGLSEFALNNKIDESLFKAILRKLDFSRIQFEKDIETFSGGQKKKVLIAKSLCEKAHLYVWDEPLNFIDVMSRIQIEELIKKYQPTLLFVEHDNTFCKNIATKIVNI